MFDTPSQLVNIYIYKQQFPFYISQNKQKS